MALSAIACRIASRNCVTAQAFGTTANAPIRIASAINAAKNGLRNQRSGQQMDETMKTYQQKAGTIEQATQFLQSIGSRT